MDESLELDEQAVGVMVEPPAGLLEEAGSPDKPSFEVFESDYRNIYDAVKNELNQPELVNLPAGQGKEEMAALNAMYPDLDAAQSIPLAGLKPAESTPQALKKAHLKRMKKLSQLKNKITDPNKDDKLEQANRLEAEMKALHEHVMDFVAQKEAYLEDLAADKDAQAGILKAFNANVSKDGKSSSPRVPPCESFKDMMELANSKEGIEFEYKGGTLSIKKGPDGRLEIRHPDPVAVAEAAAGLGKTNVEILPGTSRSQAAKIIIECNKRGIYVRNAKDYSDKAQQVLTDKGKFYGELKPYERLGSEKVRGASGVKDFMARVDAQSPAKTQGALSAAAQANKAMFDHNYNDLFTDVDPPKTAEDRIAANFINFMDHGGEVHQAKELLDLTSKSPTEIADFILNVERMLHDSRPDDGPNIPVPNKPDDPAHAPPPVKDIQAFVRDDMLDNASGMYAKVADALHAKGAEVRAEAVDVDQAAPAAGFGAGN